MGKSPNPISLHNLGRIVTSGKHRVRNPNHGKPVPNTRVEHPNPKPREVRVAESDREKQARIDSSMVVQTRFPLSMVIKDCARRWFQDALKEAKSGDTSMQVLVGQMYYRGYGVIRNQEKGRAWISKASKGRSSVWKVSNKQPGYNASDSDSSE
ncbi:hypothetical protein Dimus_026884 [Dionaea muscipula]